MIVRWLAPALAYRRAIYNYIEADNPAAAIAVDEWIRDRTRQLVDHPHLGRRGRVQGTRELVVTKAPYIAIYRQKDDVIEILRVLHQRQQWP